jgi:hypothetical protein
MLYKKLSRIFIYARRNKPSPKVEAPREWLEQSAVSFEALPVESAHLSHTVSDVSLFVYNS